MLPKKKMINLLRYQPSNHSAHRRDFGGFRTILIVFSLISAIWIISAWVLYDDPNRGTFGDMFGAINSLFSGLALTALVFAGIQQRKEIELQRYEIGFTRNEMTEQRLELKKQTATAEEQLSIARRQASEATFFQILNLLDRNVDSLTFRTDQNQIVVGRKVFPLIYDQFVREHRINQHHHDSKSQRTGVGAAFNLVWNQNELYLSKYVDTLLRLIEFVDTNFSEDKELYISLISAQWSQEEGAFLFYYCFSGKGRGQMRYLLLANHMLNGLDKKILIDETHKDALSSQKYYEFLKDDVEN